MTTERFAGDFQKPPCSQMILDMKTVHVWKVEMEDEFSRLPFLWSILSAEEHERANRFYFSPDRDRFVVCRGVLRSLIGEYLNQEPAALTFRCNPYGKPYLEGKCAETVLRFNISHSDHLALFAFTWDREIGVDIERINVELDDDQIAENFFSPTEVSTLRSLPPAQQTEAFFLGWTRKEAFIKARGEGLSIPLDRFAVSLEPGKPATLLWVQGNPGEIEKWSIRGLNPRQGYAAALVVERADYDLKCWDFSQRLYQRPAGRP